MNPTIPPDGGIVFPMIESIDDVLPAIEGREEFIVAERGEHRIVNYRVAFQDTFAVDHTDCVSSHGRDVPKGILRRECRGLVFGADGGIVSRPFHKFFNVGENESSSPDRVAEALARGPHRVMEKMDGSMVRPLVVGGELRLATKMGVTETAEQAEEAMSPDQADFLWTMVQRGLTPILEYVSPRNRIVVPYGRPELVLLAIRGNFLGKYGDLGEWNPADVPFPMVRLHGEIGEGGIAGFAGEHADDEGREGFVIQFSDGNMVKAKNPWYVRIHKVKEQVAHDRHILSLILDGGMDDALPHMVDGDRAYIAEFEARFRANSAAMAESLRETAERAWAEAGEDRRRLATETLPASGLDRKKWGFVFKWVDGASMEDLLDRFVRMRLSGNTRYLEAAELLDLGEGRVLEAAEEAGE